MHSNAWWNSVTYVILCVASELKVLQIWHYPISITQQEKSKFGNLQVAKKQERIILWIYIENACKCSGHLVLKVVQPQLNIWIGVFDTLSDSIQYLNFAKKSFIQYSIQYCFTQDSIQNIIQFKENSAGSKDNSIQ